MGLILILLLLVAPLVELYVIFQVVDVLGAWETIGLLIIESVIGAWLIKRQGLRTLTRISQAVESGRVPGKEMVDGLLIMVAGALMLAPGFVGDIFGFLLLLPPTRALVRAPLMKRFAAGPNGRLFTTVSGVGNSRFVGSFRAEAVVDATAHETPPVTSSPSSKPPRPGLGA